MIRGGTLVCLVLCLFSGWGQALEFPVNGLPDTGVLLNDHLRVLEDRDHNLTIDDMIGLTEKNFQDVADFDPESK